MVIRAARAEECHALTALAMRSKAHWGYDPAFLERARADLTVDPRAVARGDAFVAERSGNVAGFYWLDDAREAPELMALFVEPPMIGTGVGRALLAHALAQAASRGGRRLIIQSDPFAEGFYLAMGAVRVGSKASAVDASRMLPLMEVRIEA